MSCFCWSCDKPKPELHKEPETKEVKAKSPIGSASHSRGLSTMYIKDGKAVIAYDESGERKIAGIARVRFQTT